MVDCAMSTHSDAVSAKCNTNVQWRMNNKNLSKQQQRGKWQIRQFLD